MILIDEGVIERDLSVITNDIQVIVNDRKAILTDEAVIEKMQELGSRICFYKGNDKISRQMVELIRMAIS